MRCPSCGSKCRSNSTHCPRCSAPLDPKVAAYGGAARAVREAWGLDGQQETVVVPRRPVSRVMAVALVVLSIVAIVCIAILVGQNASSKPGERTLDANGFGSEALAAVLAPYDANGNGRLSAQEAAAVTELDCSGLNLTSLESIDVLVNLTVLDASDNQLTSFDPRLFTKLSVLDVSNNMLASLDMGGSAAILELDASDNGLTSLSVAGCGMLTSLVCPGNAIARLDLVGCSSLVNLVCDANQNVTIPLSSGFIPDAGLRAALAASDADGNGALSERERESLVSLTVTDPQTQNLFGLLWFPNLGTLDASNTAITYIDSQMLPKSLTTIVAHNCAIATASLANMSRLTTLDLSTNPLVSLDIAGCQRLTTLDVSGCALGATWVLGAHERLTFLDATGNPKLELIDITNTPGLQVEGAVACDDTCTVAFQAMLLEDPLVQPDPNDPAALESTVPQAPLDEPAPPEDPGAPAEAPPVA